MKKTEHYKQPVLSLSSATLPRILSSRMAAFPESQRDLLHCMHWPHHARGTFSHAPRIFHTEDALHDASQVRPLSCEASCKASSVWKIRGACEKVPRA